MLHTQGGREGRSSVAECLSIIQEAVGSVLSTPHTAYGSVACVYSASTWKSREFEARDQRPSYQRPSLKKKKKRKVYGCAYKYYSILYFEQVNDVIWLPFLRFIFSFIYVYVCIIHTSSVPLEAIRARDLLQLETQVVVSCPIRC